MFGRTHQSEISRLMLKNAEAAPSFILDLRAAAAQRHTLFERVALQTLLFIFPPDHTFTETVG